MKLGIIIRIVALLVLTPGLCRGTLFQGIVFTEDGTIETGYNGPISVEGFARVTMTGGNSDDVRVEEYGTLDVMGGTLRVRHRGVTDRGTMNLLGGSLRDIGVSDRATFNIEGGLFQGQMESFDSSVININGGEVQEADLRARDSTTINIYGGNTTWNRAELWDYSLLNVYGGVWEGGASVWQFSTVNIYGGLWEGGIGASQFSTVNIYGGDMTLGRGRIRITDSARANVYYSSIIYKPDTHHVFVLGYRLLDGSEFMLDQFTRTEIEQMNFIPEPATLLLFGLGGLLLRKRRLDADGRLKLHLSLEKEQKKQ